MHGVPGGWPPPAQVVLPPRRADSCGQPDLGLMVACAGHAGHARGAHRGVLPRAQAGHRPPQADDADRSRRGAARGAATLNFGPCTLSSTCEDPSPARPGQACPQLSTCGSQWAHAQGCKCWCAPLARPAQCLMCRFCSSLDERRLRAALAACPGCAAAVLLQAAGELGVGPSRHRRRSQRLSCCTLLAQRIWPAALQGRQLLGSAQSVSGAFISTDSACTSAALQTASRALTACPARCAAGVPLQAAGQCSVGAGGQVAGGPAGQPVRHQVRRGTPEPATRNRRRDGCERCSNAPALPAPDALTQSQRARLMCSLAGAGRRSAPRSAALGLRALRGRRCSAAGAAGGMSRYGCTLSPAWPRSGRLAPQTERWLAGLQALPPAANHGRGRPGTCVARAGALPPARCASLSHPAGSALCLECRASLWCLCPPPPPAAEGSACCV